MVGPVAEHENPLVFAMLPARAATSSSLASRKCRVLTALKQLAHPGPQGLKFGSASPAPNPTNSSVPVAAITCLHKLGVLVAQQLLVRAHS